MGLSYSESKKKALRVIIILGIITIAEVLFALWGKGYLIEGVHISPMIMGLVMIIMSLVKAYLIVYEFMHMKYEVPGLVRSVLVPTLLLVWAVIAFFYEGNYWMNSRAEASAIENRLTPTEQPEEAKIKHDDHGSHKDHDDHSGGH